MEMDTKNFPEGWKVVRLGEVCEKIIGGGTPSTKNEEYWNGDIPWISSADIHGIRDVRPRKSINEKAIENSTTNLVPKGSIIVVTRVGLGKLAIAPCDLCFSQDNQGLVLKENLIRTDYALLVLHQEVQNFLHQSRGTTINGVTKKQLVELPLALPPLAEQEQIVAKIEELFSELDAGKQEAEKALAQLKVYRQAVLKWAFEGRLTNEHVVDGALPEGWEWVKLDDVCRSVEYGSSAKSAKTGKVPVLRMGNIQNGRFDYSDLVYTSDENEINKYLLKKDDVLFNRTNSAELVGKTAIYKDERPAIFAGYLIRIHRDEALLDANFLTYYLNTEAARAYGNTVRSFGVNQSNINGTKLKTYPLPLPPLQEQHRIVQEIEAKLSVCEEIERTLAQSLQQAEGLRQSILKKAFEGKLI